MRSTLFTSRIVLQFACLIVLCGPFVQSRCALAQPHSIAFADIPFDFFVGSKALSAGRYEIVMNGNNTLRVTSDHGSQSSMVYPDSSLKPADSSKLLFDHISDHYFLKNYSKQGDITNLRLPQSRAEKQLLRTIRVSHPEDTETKLSDVRTSSGIN